MLTIVRSVPDGSAGWPKCCADTGPDEETEHGNSDCNTDDTPSSCVAVPATHLHELPIPEFDAITAEEEAEAVQHSELLGRRIVSPGNSRHRQHSSVQQFASSHSQRLDLVLPRRLPSLRDTVERLPHIRAPVAWVGVEAHRHAAVL
eukprot:2248118-Rhodomonas_salina.1